MVAALDTPPPKFAAQTFHRQRLRARAAPAVNALVKGPDEFKEGLHRGAISFHDNVMVSMGDSMHKMSGAFARGLAELCARPRTTQLSCQQARGQLNSAANRPKDNSTQLPTGPLRAEHPPISTSLDFRLLLTSDFS